MQVIVHLPLADARAAVAGASVEVSGTVVQVGDVATVQRWCVELTALCFGAGWSAGRLRGGARVTLVRQGEASTALDVTLEGAGAPADRDDLAAAVARALRDQLEDRAAAAPSSVLLMMVGHNEPHTRRVGGGPTSRDSGPRGWETVVP